MLAATVLMADTTPAAAAAATTVAAKPAEAAATATATPTAAATVTPAAKKTEKPRLICKTEQVTGSLMPKKTCYSSDELSQRRQDERQNLERIQEFSH